MENFDLFNDYTPSTNESHTSSTNVDTKMADTPPEKPTPNWTRVTTDEAVVDCSRSNILVFAHQYQRDMWTSFKHRRDCMMQVGRFAQYKDFGIRPMSDLKTRDFIQYRDYLLSTGLKKGTVNRHLSALSACFQFAVETVGLLTDRPRVPLYKEDKPNTRAFTKEMVQDLIAHFEADGDKWMADMVRLGCMTGMRQSEIVSLPLSIVEFDSSTKEVWLPSEVTKTNTGRMVSLQAGNAWDVAMRLRDTIGREFMHGRFYSRWWNAREALGHRDDKWFKFLATRHYAATTMAKAQMNSMVIAEQLGHASEATTKKYFHGDAQARGQAVSVLAV